MSAVEAPDQSNLESLLRAAMDNSDVMNHYIEANAVDVVEREMSLQEGSAVGGYEPMNAIASAGAQDQEGEDNKVPEILVGKSDDEIREIKRKAVERVENMLSSTNLPHDKYLFSLTLRNPNGWIPLSTLAKYPKIRAYAEAYGTHFIGDAIRDASDAGSGFLGKGRESEIVVDGRNERVRRREVLEKVETAWDRTVYASGFGSLDATNTTTQDAIEEWFEQFAPITVVRYKRERDAYGIKGRGAFTGAVFCEFATAEGADLFLNTNPRPPFNGIEIEAMLKESYLDKRLSDKGLIRANVQPLNPDDPHALNAILSVDKALLKPKGAAAKEAAAAAAAAGNGMGFGNGKKRKREDVAEDEVEGLEGPATFGRLRKVNHLTISFHKHPVMVNRKTGTVISKSSLVFPEKSVLKFTGVGENGDWKALKEDLVNAEIEHSVLYLPRGSTSGYFASPEPIGDEVVERLKNLHLIVGDSEIEWERVEGQEERDFYAKRASFQGKLAVKMADEKEALEASAIKETAKQNRILKGKTAAMAAGEGGSAKKKKKSKKLSEGAADGPVYTP